MAVSFPGRLKAQGQSPAIGAQSAQQTRDATKLVFRLVNA
jgi:hypothetical protein